MLLKCSQIPTKAEPFKQWLAQVGTERIDEIEEVVTKQNARQSELKVNREIGEK